jgi:ABC-type antimicrobial peptide transport system permease subunit
MRDATESIRPTCFIPFAHMRPGALTLRLEQGVPEASIARSLRQLIARQFPQLRVENVRTYRELIAAQTIRERLLAALSSFFGAVALILAGTGLYALLSYSVMQRRRELAIWLALGASPLNAAGLVLREAAIAIGWGVAVGLAAGWGAQQVIRSLLFEVSGSDPGVLGATMLAIAASSMLAAAAPAIRAVRMDPAQTLRAE